MLKKSTHRLCVGVSLFFFFSARSMHMKFGLILIDSRVSRYIRTDVSFFAVLDNKAMLPGIMRRQTKKAKPSLVCWRLVLYCSVPACWIFFIHSLPAKSELFQEIDDWEKFHNFKQRDDVHCSQHLVQFTLYKNHNFE